MAEVLRTLLLGAAGLGRAAGAAERRGAVVAAREMGLERADCRQIMLMRSSLYCDTQWRRVEPDQKWVDEVISMLD